MEGGVQLYNEKIKEEKQFGLGSVVLYEDTVVGLIISLVNNNEYKIKIVGFNACTGC